jgi:hypothetical protein
MFLNDEPTDKVTLVQDKIMKHLDFNTFAYGSAVLADFPTMEFSNDLFLRMGPHMERGALIQPNDMSVGWKHGCVG